MLPPGQPQFSPFGGPTWPHGTLPPHGLPPPAAGDMGAGAPRPEARDTALIERLERMEATFRAAVAPGDVTMIIAYIRELQRANGIN